MHHLIAYECATKPFLNLETEVALKATRARAVMTVYGGEPGGGQALELLVRGATCKVKFAARPPLKKLGLLDRVRLLIFAPRLNGKRRVAILNVSGSITAPISIPVLELVDPPGGEG